MPTPEDASSPVGPGELETEEERPLETDGGEAPKRPTATVRVWQIHKRTNTHLHTSTVCGSRAEAIVTMVEYADEFLGDDESADADMVRLNDLESGNRIIDDPLGDGEAVTASPVTLDADLVEVAEDSDPSEANVYGPNVQRPNTDGPTVDVDTLDYAGAEHYGGWEHYFYCPNCDFHLTEWMECPSCHWYDGETWERTLEVDDERDDLATDGGVPSTSELSGIDMQVFDLVRRKQPIALDPLFEQVSSYGRDEFTTALYDLRDRGFVEEVEEPIEQLEDATRDVWVVADGE